MSDWSAWEERPSRRTDRRPNDERSEFERDRARLIHSAAFRRLQAKTQVLGLSEGDFHRTRLTHSMEVAQIARGLVLQLQKAARMRADLKDALPPTELIESIAFAHDLGHPPFGHGGEVALNFMMRESGGFEGNGQSLRILSKLKSAHYPHGLDLTRRLLLGILKYPRPYSQVRRKSLPAVPERFARLDQDDWKPPKCYLDTETELVAWVLEPLSEADRSGFVALKTEPSDSANGKTAHKSLDGSLMELADDIAYGVHDFEDGVALGLIGEDDWVSALDGVDEGWLKRFELEEREVQIRELFASQQDGGNRKRTIGTIVNAMIASASITHVPEFSHLIVALRAELDGPARLLLDRLQEVVVKRIINMQTVQVLEYRGRLLVMEVFDAILSKPSKLLSRSFRERLDKEDKAMRVICDYVSGMTEMYATRIYERLYVPRQGTIFDRL